MTKKSEATAPEKDGNVSVKPYRVDFKFTVEEFASTHISARNEDDAAEGVKQMLSEMHEEYQSPEIVKVELFKKPNAPTLQ